jgi:hypothetical protein
MRLIALFNLKPGVAIEDYEAWARATDIPTVKTLKSVADFQVIKTTGVMGSDATPPYQYIEIIDVLDADQFGQDVGTVAMQKIAAEFQALADVVFLTTEPLTA